MIDQTYEVHNSWIIQNYQFSSGSYIQHVIQYKVLGFYTVLKTYVICYSRRYSTKGNKKYVMYLAY